jgi:hypothetical protein
MVVNLTPRYCLAEHAKSEKDLMDSSQGGYENTVESDIGDLQ